MTTLDELNVKVGIVLDRTERIEQILLGNAAQNAGVVTRLAGVETQADLLATKMDSLATTRTVAKAGGVGAALSGLATATVAFLLAKLGVTS